MKTTNNPPVNSLRFPVLLCLTSLAVALPCSAGSYIGVTYEGFDYPTGTVGDRDGGTGWNATGDDSLANTTSWGTIFSSADVTTGSLSFNATGYAPSTANKLMLTPGTGTTFSSSARATRNLGQTVATDSVGSVYFSFLMQKTNDSDRSLVFSFFDGGTELFAIGQNNSAPSGHLGALGVTVQGPVQQFYPTSSLVLGNEVHLIIGRLDFNVSGSDDRITLWVNPTDVTGGEGSLTPYLIVDGINLASTGLNAIRPFAGQDSGSFGRVTANFDEIRVGSSFASVTTSEPESSLRLIISPATPPATGFNLEWESQAGKLYNLLTSTDLADPIAEWDLIEGDIAATPPANEINVPEDGPRRFYAVEEFDAPPLLAENFEGNNGGFTTSTDAGTAWEWGTPASTDDGGTPNPGGSVTTGNDGSTQCWGTNIGNPGYHANPTTNSRLISPGIDLTSVAAATLSFAHAIDVNTPGGDTAVLRIVNADTDAIIQSIPFTDDNLASAAWQDAGPISLPVGAPIRLEWVLNGTGGDSADFMGWYIDDVLVTETTP